MAWVRQQIASIYSVLRDLGKTPAAEFFKRPFLDFATTDWGYCLDEKTLEQMGVAPECFLTKAVVARHLGVRPITATRILAAHHVPSRVVQCGKIERRLFDKMALTISLLSAQQLNLWPELPVVSNIDGTANG
jgi:hypothetical protein